MNEQSYMSWHCGAVTSPRVRGEVDRRRRSGEGPFHTTGFEVNPYLLAGSLFNTKAQAR
jgi:hypothetical protein